MSHILTFTDTINLSEKILSSAGRTNIFTHLYAVQFAYAQVWKKLIKSPSKSHQNPPFSYESVFSALLVQIYHVVALIAPAGCQFQVGGISVEKRKMSEQTGANFA